MKRFVLLALLCAGCAREGVHVIPKAQLPQDLYARPRESPSAAVSRETLVYFVRGARVAPAMRTASGTQRAEEFVVRELLAGPNPAESAAGLTSAIPDGTELLGVTLRDDVAFVNLSREFELGAAQEVLVVRLAQVVYTLTGLRRVDSVQFLIDGERVDVVGESGTIRQDPVGRADYASLAQEGGQAAALPPSPAGP